MATTFAVPDGRVAMNAVLRNGFGTSGGSITSLNFQPDLVWEKPRNIVSDHELQDSVRGATKSLHSNTAGVEDTYPNYLTSFISNGYTFGTGDYGTSVTAVDWCWKAGGTAVSNTAGTITSSVSANTTAGFSVVTFTGNTTAGATVGHGLGVAPGLILIKARTGAYDWTVYHSAIGATKYLILDGAYAALTDIRAFNNTAPTVNVFSLGSAVWANNSGAMVAYCWAPVAGYSAFGSYTGNGSADGPFIYTGFRPRWLMIKRTDGIGNWWMFDTSRSTYNVAVQYLIADTAAVEGSDNAIDILSNGFKLRIATYQPNTSGATFVYAAYAENPLKYANAR
jgi:hypothetical protein